MKSVHIRSYYCPHFPAFGLNTERYSVEITERLLDTHHSLTFSSFSFTVLKKMRLYPCEKKSLYRLQGSNFRETFRRLIL